MRFLKKDWRKTGTIFTEMMSLPVNEAYISIVFAAHDDEFLNRADQSIEVLDERRGE